MQNTQFVENVQVMSNLISANIHGHESREVKQVVDKCYRESLDHIIRSAIRWEPQQVMSWLNKGVQLRERREGLYALGFKYVQIAADELKVMLKRTHGRSHEELVAKMLEDMGMWHLIGSEPHLLNTSAVADTCALWQERGWSRNLPNPTQVVQSHEVDKPEYTGDELDPDPEHHCVADRTYMICTCPDCMPEE